MNDKTSSEIEMIVQNHIPLAQVLSGTNHEFDPEFQKMRSESEIHLRESIQSVYNIFDYIEQMKQTSTQCFSSKDDHELISILSKCLYKLLYCYESKIDRCSIQPKLLDNQGKCFFIKSIIRKLYQNSDFIHYFQYQNEHSEEKEIIIEAIEYASLEYIKKMKINNKHNFLEKLFVLNDVYRKLSNKRSSIYNVSTLSI